MTPYTIQVVDFSDIMDFINDQKGLEFDRQDLVDELLGRDLTWGTLDYSLVSLRVFCDALRDVDSLSLEEARMVIEKMTKDWPHNVYINMES